MESNTIERLASHRQYSEGLSRGLRNTWLVNAGWTEADYGWLHQGKWVKDFRDIYIKRKCKIESR